MPNLAPYLNVVTCAREQRWAQAARALEYAYRVRPPRQLTVDECKVLRAAEDDLVYVGQLLPCLRPTLHLIGRFQELLSPSNG